MNENKLFPNAMPEEVGISSKHIYNFLKRLDDIDMPMHSVIIMRYGKVIFETYYEPYKRDTLHRMFSVTKALVSIAIGLLEEEGKLSLDDKIVNYFEEKLPKDGVHPYIEATTIRDMLKMASAHSKTTFKTLRIDDWVKTFFVVEPTHIPGTCFSYDTSATHTLAALVEKLSGMELLEYLRVKFLDEIGFSKAAYCLKDPVGVSMGGSGIMATPYDLLRVMYVVMNGGVYNGKRLLPERYLKQATSKQIDTYAKTPNFEEMQGYGYQFWKTTHNGFVAYGMGGQLGLCIPKEDLILVTTADTQGRQGGVQFLYDAFWQEIFEKISDKPLKENSAEYNKLLIKREIKPLSGSNISKLQNSINNVVFKLDNNKMEFENISLSFENEFGVLSYKNRTGEHSIKFGIGKNEIISFPYYNYKAVSSGIWRDENTFLIKCHIVDECVGSVYIQLSFKEGFVTVMMRKFEENYFKEFDGIVSGVAL